MTRIKERKTFFVYVINNGLALVPPKVPFLIGMWAPFIARFLGQCESAPVFVGLRLVTNRQTNTTQKLTTPRRL